MNLYGLTRTAALVALSVLALPAAAHDPAYHQKEVAKEKPTTCEQLADRERYSNDLSDPDIKALKDTCDAEAQEKDDASRARS